MAYLVCWIVLGFALVMTLAGGVGPAFAAAYLPALLLLGPADRAPIPLLPLFNPAWAALLGVALIWSLQSGKTKLGWCAVDALVLLVAVWSGVATAINSGGVHAGQTVGFRNLLNWAVPFLMARAAARSADGRRLMLASVAVCIVLIGLVGTFESRAWPGFWEWVLHKVGLRAFFGGRPLLRYGFYRAHVSLIHPIYLSNSAVIVGAMVLMLSATTRSGSRRLLAGIGTAGAILAIVAAVSFSGLNGLAASVLAFAALTRMSVVRRRLWIFLLAAMMSGVGVTFALRNVDATRSEDMPPWEDSLRVRAAIVQDKWPMITTAGFFGYGEFASPEQYEQLGVERGSTDNSYLVFIIFYGWSFLGLWMLMLLIWARRMSVAMELCRTKRVRTALTIGTAVVLGMLVSMYTVWASPAYTTLWFVLMGCTVSVAQESQVLAVEGAMCGDRAGR